MKEQERHNLFSMLVARHQSELYAYIFTVVRNWQDADDLFQSVCVILWQKFDSFQPGSSFFSWARQIAKYEIRKYLTNKKKPTYVNDTLLDAFAETTLSSQRSGIELALDALRHCRGKLDASDEELLELRYVHDLGSREIASRLNRPQTSVCRSLNRIRTMLLNCVQMELNRQKSSGREIS